MPVSGWTLDSVDIPMLASTFFNLYELHITWSCNEFHIAKGEITMHYAVVFVRLSEKLDILKHAFMFKFANFKTLGELGFGFTNIWFLSNILAVLQSLLTYKITHIQHTLLWPLTQKVEFELVRGRHRVFLQSRLQYSTQ